MAGRGVGGGGGHERLVGVSLSKQEPPHQFTEEHGGGEHGDHGTGGGSFTLGGGQVHMAELSSMLLCLIHA